MTPNEAHELVASGVRMSVEVTDLRITYVAGLRIFDVLGKDTGRYHVLVSHHGYMA